MGPRPTFDTDEAQSIREDLAKVHARIEKLAENQPEHGQHITFAKNNVRSAFMELGFGIAMTKGFDPFANKVEQK